MIFKAIWSTQEEMEPYLSEEPGFLSVLAIMVLLLKLKDSVFPLKKKPI